MSVRTPVKPDRTRGANGRYQCYKCPNELAVAGVREKCCRSCLAQLVRKSFAAELAALRQLFSTRSVLPRSSVDKSVSASVDVIENDPPLYLALSGGDASLSLLHVTSELLEKRRKARRMQRQKRADRHSSNLSSAQPLNADFGCCVALHVDVQRLFIPRGSVTELMGELTGGQDQSPSSSSGSCVANDADCYEGVYGIRIAAPDTRCLPLQLQRVVAEKWPSVHFVLLHPFGNEFSVIEEQHADKSSGGCVEVYRHHDGRRFSREQLEAMLQQEEQLAQLFSQTVAQDETAAIHLCRALMLRSVRQYFLRHFKSAASPQDAHHAFLCVGDTACVAALTVLERVSYGEGRLLGMECASVDARHLPLFHLCRPFVTMSKKELALFRLFEDLPVLPTLPYYSLHGVIPLPLAEGCGDVPVRSGGPSVRWLLQEFLLEMQKGNSAVVHNLLSASGKLELTFNGWRSDTPCCLCWKAPALDLAGFVAEERLFTPQQLRVVEEHLLLSAASTRLCFACIRDATAASSAARIALSLCESERES